MKKMNSVLFGIWLLVFSSHAAIGTGATFDEVVVFGDSLSDNGNLVIVEGQPLPDPTLYYQGRLSNGPVWVEYLTNPRHLGTALSDKAYGGANSSGLLPPASHPTGHRLYRLRRIAALRGSSLRSLGRRQRSSQRR